jgi:hypothetical protein
VVAETAGVTVIRLALVGVLFDGPRDPTHDTAATPITTSRSATPAAVAARRVGCHGWTACAGRPDSGQPVTVCGPGR